MCEIVPISLPEIKKKYINLRKNKVGSQYNFDFYKISI